jgi:hypothetical protein
LKEAFESASCPLTESSRVPYGAGLTEMKISLVPHATQRHPCITFGMLSPAGVDRYWVKKGF